MLLFFPLTYNFSCSDGGAVEDDTFVPRESSNGVYSTIEEIEASVGNTLSYCIDTYMVDVEIKMLQSSLTTYQTKIRDGYDGKFSIYARHVKALVPAQINAYMAGAQDTGIFACTTTGYVVCCKDCQSAGGCPPTCDYSTKCQSGIRTWRIMCPTEIPDPADQESDVTNVDYYCVDTEKFYTDMAQLYGIDRSWITWGKFLAKINGGSWQNPDPHCADDTNTFWTNFSLAGDIIVPNPKDLIAGSYDKTQDFTRSLAIQRAFMPYGVNVAQMSDLVDAVSVPALLAASAVDSMSNVVEAADDITADERKAMILNFVMAVLLLIPGVGEIADAAGLAALRTMITLVGDTENIALGIYGIVEDPQSAVFAMFGLLLGGGGSGKSFIDAAATRRRFSDEDKTTLAPIRGNLDKISNVRSLYLRQ
jgi:chitinase